MKLHVQVYDGSQWLESKYGGDTMEEAEAARDTLCKNDAAWMTVKSPEERKKLTRIMPKKPERFYYK